MLKNIYNYLLVLEFLKCLIQASFLQCRRAGLQAKWVGHAACIYAKLHKYRFIGRVTCATSIRNAVLWCVYQPECVWCDDKSTGEPKRGARRGCRGFAQLWAVYPNKQAY